MTDEFYNPGLLLGDQGLQTLWPNNPWYSSLYNSGYVYYPALDVTSGTGTNTNNRLGRQGREWFQHPDAWTMSARMNRYEGRHNLKWGGEMRSYYGEAARFEPINLVFNSALTANSSVSSDVVNSGNQWATFMLGALDNQTSARLVPLQNPDLRGYAAYFQDDFHVNNGLTLNAGLRWEYEPGPIDPDNRLSQQLDLTQPIPEMQTTPPAMPAQALQLMASKSYSYIYNGAWNFTSASSRHAWHSTPWNFLPRFGVNQKLGANSVLRFAYARYLMPTSNVRDTLGDFVNQYAGFAQTTNTLGLANGVPRQNLADPFPSSVNPVIEPYGQSYGRYTNLGSAVSLDQHELRPQVNDRFNLSYQRQIWAGTIIDLNYFYNYGTRVPFDKNLNMADPAFRYEYKTLLNTQVANPFRNYLTPDKFPGQLRNTTTVSLGSLLVPYPQYGAITQTNTDGRKMRTQTFEIRAQRPFAKGTSFPVSYRITTRSVRSGSTTSRSKRSSRPVRAGNGGRPTCRSTRRSRHPADPGRTRARLPSEPPPRSTWPSAVSGNGSDAVLLRTAAAFGNSYVVDANPTLAKPTRDLWFDTSVFHTQDTFTPRSNARFYDGLTGPSAFVTDMTLTKNFNLTSKYRIEARVEAYNAFNNIIWDNPDVDLASATFGKVTRKRIDGAGREIQIGARFVF
jgi:hypothetical protein